MIPGHDNSFRTLFGRMKSLVLVKIREFYARLSKILIQNAELFVLWALKPSFRFSKPDPNRAN